MQQARANAISLYMDLVISYCHDPERWASAKSTVLAAGRLALPYCLKHLSGWLAHGGMALGAHPPLCVHGCCAWKPCQRTLRRRASVFGIVCSFGGWYEQLWDCMSPIPEHIII